LAAAQGIEEAQQAWTALGDTLVSSFADTGMLDWLTGGLKQAAETLRQIVLLATLFSNQIKYATGQMNALQAQEADIAAVQKWSTVQTKSVESNRKETAKAEKDITAELRRQQDLLDDADEAVRKGDARALMRTQKELSKSNVTVSFKGSPALVSLVQDVIIDGVRER